MHKNSKKLYVIENSTILNISVFLLKWKDKTKVILYNGFYYFCFLINKLYINNFNMNLQRRS
jgi:hypothetical protein